MGLVSRAQHAANPILVETPASASLYPDDIPVTELTPTSEKFDVFEEPVIGRGIRATVAFERGSVMASFTGRLTGDVLQHTLQVSPTSHVHDPHFIGLLSHSCAPNTLLDMTRLDLLALTDIMAGEVLTLDYALTEDVLYRQFPCTCGSNNCRHWVTGRREKVNAEGRVYLAGLDHLQ